MRGYIEQLRGYAYNLADKQRDKFLGIATDIERYATSPSDEWLGDKLFYDKMDAAESAIKFCEATVTHKQQLEADRRKKDEEQKKRYVKESLPFSIENYEQDGDEGFAAYIRDGVNYFGLSIEYMIFEKNLSEPFGHIRKGTPDPLTILIEKETAQIVTEWLTNNFTATEQLIIYEAWHRYAFEDFNFRFDRVVLLDRYAAADIDSAEVKLHSLKHILVKRLAE